MRKLILIFLGLICFTRTAFSQEDPNSVMGSEFFKLFINGETEKAYQYFDEEFKQRVSLDKMSALQKDFTNSFGAFKAVVKASPFTQKDVRYIILSTSFEKANPVFALTLDDQNKIAGLFTSAANYITKYADPSYSNKDLYTEEKILIQTGDFKMPGILTRPTNGSDYPVVIFVHGSGPQNMDEQTGNLKPFRDLALGLATKGIASVRYDKRTKVYGAKSVQAGGVMTTKEELTDDAASAIKFAGKLTNVDPKKIFILGHSLGAQFAPEIALANPAVSGIVMVSAPGRSFGAMLDDQFRYLIKDSSALATQLKVAAEISHADTIKNQNTILMGAPASYFTALNKHNQVLAAKKLKLPVLILQGERDYQVTLTDLNIWKQQLGKNKNVTIKSYPKLNHAFTEGSGTMSTASEYNIPANVPFYVIEDISHFIKKSL